MRLLVLALAMSFVLLAGARGQTIFLPDGRIVTCIDNGTTIICY